MLYVQCSTYCMRISALKGGTRLTSAIITSIISIIISAVAFFFSLPGPLPSTLRLKTKELFPVFPPSNHPSTNRRLSVFYRPFFTSSLPFPPSLPPPFHPSIVHPSIHPSLLRIYLPFDTHPPTLFSDPEGPNGKGHF